jgi:hypothetical protein
MKFIGTQTIYDDIRLVKSIYLTGPIHVGNDGLGDLTIVARDVFIKNDEVDSGSDTTSGDPTFRVGASDAECLQISSNYQTNTKSMQLAIFTTKTESATANDGRFRFNVDQVSILEIDDGGIDFYSGFAGGISFNGTDILTDNGSGTTTLANIDALDSTTISTISSAISAGDITGVTITTDTGSGGRATEQSGNASFSILGSSGVGVTNSGTTITATSVPSEIDHDSLLNFVANEHLRWDTDVSSTATIHASNIPTLNQNTTGSAATLTTERDLKVDLAEGNAAGFNGSADALNIGVGTSVLGAGNGGTGLTSISTLLNSNTTKSDVGLGNVENKSAATIIGEIVAGDIPTLNQNTTGSAATLTASTSNALGIGSVELGHADDTTIARSAAGIVSVEGKNIRTVDRTLFIKQGSFSVNQGTTRVYFPMAGTAENTSANGPSIPFIAPVDGKLLKIHFRSNKDHSGFVTTFALLNWDSNEAFTTGNASDVGTKEVTMANQNNVTTIDFQSSLTSGTNVFTAGETMGISLQTASSIGQTTKYWFTAVFEFDFSSY